MTTWAWFDVALVTNVALDGGRLGDVWEIFDYFFVRHFYDYVNGDMAETDVNVAEEVFRGSWLFVVVRIVGGLPRVFDKGASL